VSEAPQSLLYTNKLSLINKGTKTCMEIRIREGYFLTEVPNYTLRDNIQEDNKAYRVKARDSKWIPYIGKPIRGMRGIIPQGIGTT